MKTNTQEAIADSCKNIFDTAKKDIDETIDGRMDELRDAAYKLNRFTWKNLLLNFVTALVLLVFGIGGTIYALNYRDGTKIAEAKAEEALAAERAKLENDIEAQKRQIERDAIQNYKNSESFTEDACIKVASNIRYTNIDYYLYKYMKSTDLNEYPDLKTFYDRYLKRGWQQYKE